MILPRPAILSCDAHKSMLVVFCFIVAVATWPDITNAAEIRVIAADSHPVIAGKEVDWIYGDYLMSNDQLSMIIAAPVSTRDASMTVRNIGGSIIDLTLNDPSNDQLSVYTPTGGRYFFHDPAKIKTGKDDRGVFWQCESSKTVADDGTTATIEYRLADADSFVESTVTINGDAASNVATYDTIRADGWFVFEKSDSLAYCTDTFHRQTIGFRCVSSSKPPQWKKGRPTKLIYDLDVPDVEESAGKTATANGDAEKENTAKSVSWIVHLYPATSPIDLIAAAEMADASPTMFRFEVQPKSQPTADVDWVNRAEIIVRPAGQLKATSKEALSKEALSKETLSKEALSDELAVLQTDDQGIAHARLVPGNYVAIATAEGYEPTEVAFQSGTDETTLPFMMTGGSGFDAEAKDDAGNWIPVKATIYNTDGDDPDLGPSSTRTFVENCVYSVHGRFHCPLDPGKYEVHFSRGPEHNSDVRQIEVVANQFQKIAVQLDRVVDTTGWVSTELHSHSSPSGDNTSDQFGRVENLLCEHLEFAPCTEHNRVSSYTPHLEQMKLPHLMATCTGIELTGSPLPANHQNAFPLHHHPHTQNGGGPRTSSNPVVQIERLAMWDGGSDKLVQMNHPNLHQVYGDLDVDGTPDKGFRGMLKWMDVVEVHPLQTIFKDVASSPPSVRRMRIPLFQWMQLLNQGHRIPGVVNTDAHYNHHGSGWLRNWFACSTDDPANISTDEMIRQAEAGHIIMSTGPFLQVTGRSQSSKTDAIPGDDLVTSDGKVTLQISVQCPNWLDVNRVQLFVNGRPSDQHNYTRKNSPAMFGDVAAVRKFDSSVVLELDSDAHVIVATIGEGIAMEKVMGKREGKRPPIAVSNPIFIDVDGKGFQPNGDELGLPLPGLDH